MFLLDLVERLSATHEPRHINFDLFDQVVRGKADLWEVMADLQWEERFRCVLNMAVSGVVAPSKSDIDLRDLFGGVCFASFTHFMLTSRVRFMQPRLFAVSCWIVNPNPAFAPLRCFPLQCRGAKSGGHVWVPGGDGVPLRRVPEDCAVPPRHQHHLQRPHRQQVCYCACLHRRARLWPSLLARALRVVVGRWFHD